MRDRCFRPGEPSVSASSATLPERLGLAPFRQAFPWYGPDLQTLRDSLCPPRGLSIQADRLLIPLPRGGQLLALLSTPAAASPIQGLVLLVHGLGSHGDTSSLIRLSRLLLDHRLAVLRLNLRGAGAGRDLAAGSYAAACSSDLLPAFHLAHQLASDLGSPGQPLPVLGNGLSLGGTILLNAIAAAIRQGQPHLQALACVSSPLDLQACSGRIGAARNHLYERWLVAQLRRLVLADGVGLSSVERLHLCGADPPRSIRAFDAAITAPGWRPRSTHPPRHGPSGARWLGELPGLPPTLLLQALDDPWVPAAGALAFSQLHSPPNLAALPPQAAVDVNPAAMASGQVASGPGSAGARALEVCITRHGGHNGFHAAGDSRDGRWSDRLTARWLLERSQARRPH